MSNTQPTLLEEKNSIYSTFGNDPEYKELIVLFLNDLHERINSMKSFFESENWAGLQRIAHQLKGAAGSYGFDPISDCSTSLEHALKAGEPKEFIRKLTDELISMCQSARSGAPPYVRFCT
jgi:HPt (histidine-containing phosphotransfer) domain-containing protein